MKNLSMIAAAATLLISATAPSFAATRTHRVYNDPPNAMAAPYDPVNGSYARAPIYNEPNVSGYTYGGYGQPYSDRAYGAPDRW